MYLELLQARQRLLPLADASDLKLKLY